MCVFLPACLSICVGLVSMNWFLLSRLSILSHFHSFCACNLWPTHHSKDSLSFGHENDEDEDEEKDEDEDEDEDAVDGGDAAFKSSMHVCKKPRIFS